jgi:hypothetical protein
MRSVIAQEFNLVTLGWSITVAPGTEAKVIALWVSMAQANAVDQLIVEYRRGPNTMIVASSPGTAVQSNRVSLAIGLQATQNVENLVDPITGAISYDTNVVDTTGGLPDIWLPWDFTVSAVLFSGLVTEGRLIYESRNVE